MLNLAKMIFIELGHRCHWLSIDAVMTLNKSGVPSDEYPGHLFVWILYYISDI